MVKKDTIQIQRMGPKGEIIKLIPTRIDSDTEFIQSLYNKIKTHSKESNTFIIDFGFNDTLTDAITALLCELTGTLRRMGGDLYIVNAGRTFRSALSEFNPADYLSIAPDEEKLIQALETHLPHAARTVPPPAESPLQTKDTQKEHPNLPSSEIKRHRVIDIPYEHSALYKACDFVAVHAKEMGFNKGDLSRINIAVYEACLNAIEHARRGAPYSKIQVAVDEAEDMLKISIVDHGKGFDAEQASEFNITEAASKSRGGGMGLHIIRRAMDKVDYIRNSLYGNQLVMIKYLPKQ
ncbi:MAG: ATP-binding protein [candidate division KSB1 bacterium]|nr:ATP-binding protein [candidate division KSB1 bacterium]